MNVPLRELRSTSANASGSRLHLRVHLAHGGIIENERAALGAPDVQTLHVDRNAAASPTSSMRPPRRDRTWVSCGHRERFVRVDVSDHVHRTCLRPRAGRPRGDGAPRLRRFARDPVCGGEVNRHRVAEGPHHARVSVKASVPPEIAFASRESDGFDLQFLGDVHHVHDPVPRRVFVRVDGELELRIFGDFRLQPRFEAVKRDRHLVHAR